jgi:hypothetical protein
MNPESKAEERINCNIIDLPGLYHINNENFDGLFSALSNSDWYDLFGKSAIQNFITYNYRLTRKYTIIRMFLPFILFMVLFELYVNFVNI